VRERHLSVEDDLSYLREFEHITLARVLLARSKSEHSDRFLLEAIELLERLLQAAEVGGRRGSAIEILVVQALAHQARGDISTALLPLQQALTLAEPEGYVRIFVDEGPATAHLLERMKDDPLSGGRGGRMKEYIQKLRAAFESNEGGRMSNENDINPISSSLHPSSSPGAPRSAVLHPLVEPLSQRELEVLRLFKTELSGPEIAAELVIGLSTLRTHTKSIYSKLNVNSRRAAVNRAEELGLI
jgi:LuxR family maltose regulon positive regulatory protein